jgi:hypothetical protein
VRASALGARGSAFGGRVVCFVVEKLTPTEPLDPAGLPISPLGAGVEDAAGEVAVAEGVHLALDAGDVLAPVVEK